MAKYKIYQSRQGHLGGEKFNQIAKELGFYNGHSQYSLWVCAKSLVEANRKVNEIFGYSSFFVKGYTNINEFRPNDMRHVLAAQQPKGGFLEKNGYIFYGFDELKKTNGIDLKVR